MSGAVVVGHNVRFDLSFLAGEFRRCRRAARRMPRRLPPRAGHRPHRPAAVRPRRERAAASRPAARRRCRRLRTGAGRRGDDVGVFEKLMEPVGGWDLCLCDAIAQQGGPMGLLPASPRESLLPLELPGGAGSKVDGDDGIRRRRRARRTERMIEPLQVRRFKGELILVAHCHLRNDRRNFKLDRIVRAEAAAIRTMRPAPAARPGAERCSRRCSVAKVNVPATVQHGIFLTT